jgi:hypothetical protein
VFCESDSGPFWLSDRQREDSRLDVQLGTANIVQLKMNANIELLTAAYVLGTEGKNMRQLKDLCVDHGILTFKSVLNSVERNRAELELSLRGKGIGTQGKNERELVELCERHSIAITKTAEKIRERWEGKLKGLLQILWERGLMDGNNEKHYSQKDQLGKVDESTSLRHIMGMCRDFMNEEGMLQHIATSLGVKVL